jgi:hypothetical protein
MKISTLNYCIRKVTRYKLGFSCIQIIDAEITKVFAFMFSVRKLFPLDERADSNFASGAKLFRHSRWAAFYRGAAVLKNPPEQLVQFGHVDILAAVRRWGESVNLVSTDICGGIRGAGPRVRENCQ